MGWHSQAAGFTGAPVARGHRRRGGGRYSAKVVTLSGNYSDDFAIFWMTHCPPALFKLPQNWAASSVDPNGPTMVR